MTSRHSKSVPRHLRIPFSQFVVHRKFDRIMDVLLKENDSENLHLWLQGHIPHCHPYTPSPNEWDYTGETPLHQIAAVQPPGTFGSA
jgi:hypothetical protein